MSTDRICFVTEIDLEAPFVGGGMVNDFKTIRCLRTLGDVDVIFLQKLKYVPILSALIIFIFQLMRSFSKPYRVYFSRALIASTILVMFKPIFKRKIAHQALSVPFPSSEVKYIPRDQRAHVGQSPLEARIRYSLTRLMEKHALPNVDFITVAAPEYAQQLIEFGVEKDKVEVVPFYVEEEFYKQPMKRNTDGAFKFCYIGAFHQYHDLSSLIEAFELLSQTNSNVELLLVGEGPTRSQIESEVARRKLTDKIKFLGCIPHSSMPTLLAKIDVFVLLTRAPGLPIGLLEAAAAGKPIIAVKKKQDDALSRLFRHAKEVYFVDSFSPKQVAEAMELLYNEVELRNLLAKQARETARQHFAEDLAFQRLQDLLARL